MGEGITLKEMIGNVRDKDREPLISVIIPIYNREDTLKRCLYSVLNNTYKNIEVICVNDGSTDSSAWIMEQVASVDNRVCAINKQNRGVSSARNAGLAMSNGDYIAFVDADDWVHPQYFSILMKGMIESGYDVAACVYTRVEQYTDEMHTLNEEAAFFKNQSDKDILNDHYLKCFVWGRIYRRSIVGNEKFNESLFLAEDTVFNLNVICKNTKIDFGYYSENLYYYYDRTDSAIYTIEPRMLLKTIEYAYLPDYYRYKNRVVILEHVCRLLLVARYSAWIKREQDYLQECETLISQTLPFLGELSFFRRLMYDCLLRSLFLYRCIRILNDPSMLTCERESKNRRDVYSTQRGI